MHLWLTSIAEFAGPLLGCAGMVKEVAGETAQEVAEKATGPAIREILEALNDPVNRRLIADLVSDRDIAAAVRNLSDEAIGGAMDAATEPARVKRLRDMMYTMTGAVVGGALDASTDPQRQARVRDATGRLIATTTEELGRSMDVLRPHAHELGRARRDGDPGGDPRAHTGGHRRRR